MARQFGGCQWSPWAKAARISMILQGMSIEDLAKEVGGSYQQVCKVLQESDVSDTYKVTIDHSTLREKICDLLRLKHICMPTDTVGDILDTELLSMK